MLQKIRCHLATKFWRLIGLPKIAPRYPIWTLTCIVFRICMTCCRQKSGFRPKNPPKRFLCKKIDPFSLWEELLTKLMKSGQSYGYTWKAWDNTWFAGKIKKCWTSSQSVSFWRVLLFDKEAMKSPIWNRDISVESDNLLWKCSGWSCHTKNISSLIQHMSI